jgi:quinol-cytochrome oxidoreductase complex cytochrome b subunit
MFQALKHVPEAVGVTLFSLGAVFLVLVPFLDRKASRGERSPGFDVLFWCAMAGAACLQVWALLSPRAEQATAGHGATTPPVAPTLLMLALFWALIGFLVYYLWRLLQQNTHIRKLYPAAKTDYLTA